MRVLTFKPMLAGKAPADLADLSYPVLASPKLDGIRCLTINDHAVSRTLKAIPNDYIRTWIEDHLPNGLDGELLLTNWTEPFREVSSAVMKKSGEPDFVFATFDYSLATQAVTFEKRLWALMKLHQEDLATHGLVGVDEESLHHFQVVAHQTVNNVEELLHMHAEHLQMGFEGTMVRDPKGPYKFGRSTTREGYLLKIKNFVDEEAVVIGVEEQMHNTNEAEKDNLGHTKRSSAKAGKVGKGTLGALRLRFDDGTEFACGTGFDDEERQCIWMEHLHQDGYILGRIAKIKHQPDPGGRQPGQKPRIPVFLGWRKD